MRKAHSREGMATIFEDRGRRGPQHAENVPKGIERLPEGLQALYLERIYLMEKVAKYALKVRVSDSTYTFGPYDGTEKGYSQACDSASFMMATEGDPVIEAKTQKGSTVFMRRNLISSAEIITYHVNEK